MSVRNIKSEKHSRRVRKVSGIIAISGGTPSVSSGAGFTISDDGAGLVTVTPDLAGRSLLGVQAMAIESTSTAAHIVKAISATASAVQFGVFVVDGTDGVLADNVGFSFELTLKDVSN